MAGERTIKIRISGDATGVDRASKSARKSLEKLGENGAGLFKNLGSSLVSTLSSSGIYGAAAIVAAIAAAAPAIGAAVTAGILLGFGGGALALGIAAAMKDPKVKAAFEPLKKTAADIAKSFGEPFKAPLIRAAKTFDDALKRMKPTFDEIAKAIAPLVDKLAPALASMAEKALPGIEKLIKASVPLFESLAKKAPEFGTAVSKFLEAIAKGGPGAQKFLEDTFDFLIWVLPKVGSFLGWLSNTYVAHREAVKQSLAAIKSAWSSVSSFFSETWSKLKNGLSSVGESWNNFKNRVNGVWDSIEGKISSAISRIEGWWNRLKALASNAINFNVGGFSIPGLSGARAAGGPVGAGRSYLVGEKGPEILTMGSSSGHITPNHQLGGGGDTYVAYVDLGNGVQQRIDLEFKKQNRATRMDVLAQGGRR